jgi:uncharacterized protein YbjQ (UPF0145 family)
MRKVILEPSPTEATRAGGAPCPKCHGTDTRIVEELSGTDRWGCGCGHKWRVDTSLRPSFLQQASDASNFEFDLEMTTTALELPGYRIIRNLGVVQGLVVRSRSIVGNMGASLQMVVGGDITLFTTMCEQSRQHACRKMLLEAVAIGGNAVVSMRYDATEIAPGVAEVLAYGTAVVVENEGRQRF